MTLINLFYDACCIHIIYEYILFVTRTRGGLVGYRPKSFSSVISDVFSALLYILWKDYNCLLLVEDEYM